MKVRCKGCGKIVEPATAAASSTCSECSCSLGAVTQPSPTLSATTSGSGNSSKGELPTRNKSARNAGYLIIGFLYAVLIAAPTTLRIGIGSWPSL
jgi:hypothetical protein